MKLSREANKIYKEIRAEYKIHDSAGLLILQTVCESYDQYQKAAEILAEKGYFFTDRLEQPKAHPLAAVMRDSKSAMIQALRQLNLDFTQVDKFKMTEIHTR